MARANRDDFLNQTKRVIASRVSHRCSNPTCGAATCGPTQSPSKHLNIGVAAHITAAAPGGPRYDPALSPEERRSPENGIWLCQNCGKLNDNDPDRFSVELLRHWKTTAEANALQNVGQRSPFDRQQAPQLVVHASFNSEIASSSSVVFPAEVIERIRGLFPQHFSETERVHLLSQGIGRLGRKYAVLGLSSNHAWKWKVLFFAEEEFSWNLVANTELDGQKGYIPEVIYVPGEPGALVLTHVVLSGTGVFRRTTSWYRIREGELIPLLSYPHYFHVAGWGMPFSRVLSVKSIEFPTSLSQGALLHLRFEIKYSILDSKATNVDNELFTLIEDLALEWCEELQVFAPRKGTDNFARIEDLWSDGTEQFANRNRSALERLLQTGTNRQREFIREHLIL